MKFSAPDLSDKRIPYAIEYLESKGFERVSREENSDFILLGVNPDKKYLSSSLPVFAGNAEGKTVTDYTRVESFALKNAFLTAEGAVSLSIEKSGFSLAGSRVLITGYGRIARALHYYITPFTKSITVCARSKDERISAECFGARAADFDILKKKLDFDYIFNTVPYPVFNSGELSRVKKGALIIDLASFPGGVDKNYSNAAGINLIIARGLPSLYSPASAGMVVGETVYNLAKEGNL